MVDLGGDVKALIQLEENATHGAYHQRFGGETDILSKNLRQEIR